MLEPPRLSVQDAFWLDMDKPTNLMVVDSLLWTSEPIDWDRYREVIRTRLWERYPVFRCVPRRDRQGGWRWVEQLHDDFEAHFEQVLLPGPGDDAALQQLIASLRPLPLDRDRPLWRHFLVDGYRGGSAVVMRTHHAVADGIRMVQLTLSVGDASPQGGTVAAPRTRQHRSDASAAEHAPRSERSGNGSVPRELGARAGTTVRMLREVAADPVGTTTVALVSLGGLGRTCVRNPVAAARTARGLVTSTVGSTVARAQGSMLRAGRGGRATMDLASALPGDVDVLRKLMLGTRNDSTYWTGHAGTRKAVGWSSPLPLAQVKQVAHVTGTTVNDVLVTCVADSLRTYLQCHQATCASVTWDVPVNLKPLDATLPTQLGNSFAIVQLELPTNIADPLAELDVVRRRMSRIKHGHEASLAFAVQAGLARLNQTVYRTLVDLLADRAVGVLTNVPGPEVPIYIAGRRVEGAMGWAPLSGDQAMSVTIFSYAEQVFVGIACDVGLVPDHLQIVDGFGEAFRRLAAVAAP